MTQSAELLAKAEDDILACIRYSPEDLSRICSTNPLERVNQELKRRMYVLGFSTSAPQSTLPSQALPQSRFEDEQFPIAAQVFGSRF